MKKIELIEAIAEGENNGEKLVKGQSIRYLVDNLNNQELHSLANNHYADYDVALDGNKQYIIITRK